jgi:hypothetical protein
VVIDVGLVLLVLIVIEEIELFFLRR